MFADAPRSMTTRRLMYLADLYASYASGDFIFDAVNIGPVLDGLDDRERALLDFDVRRNRLAIVHSGRAHHRAAPPGAEGERRHGGVACQRER